MTFKRVFWLAIFGLVFLIVAAILTRPSETRLLETFADCLIESQTRHVDSCSKCDESAIATRQYMVDIVKTQRIGEPTLLRYHDYLLFSTLTTGSSTNVNVFGIMGFAFGPKLPDVPFCKGDVTFVEPKPWSKSEISDSAFRIIIVEGGVVSVAGNFVTETELRELLETAMADSELQVVIEAERKVKYRDLDKLKQVIRDAGYDDVITSVGPSDESDSPK